MYTLKYDACGKLRLIRLGIISSVGTKTDLKKTDDKFNQTTNVILVQSIMINKIWQY